MNKIFESEAKKQFHNITVLNGAIRNAKPLSLLDKIDSLLKMNIIPSKAVYIVGNDQFLGQSPNQLENLRHETESLIAKLVS